MNKILKKIKEKKIFSLITRIRPWPFIFLGFLAVNLLFNYKFFWHQLIYDTSLVGAVFGETQIYEWGMNHLYKNILSGHNPFGTTTAAFYPFGIDFTTNDYGFGLFYLFFRPFLSIHQTFYVILPLSLLAANIGMYKLLRLLGFDRPISFLMGLAYGYMTFLTVRLGHANYFAIYIFPWFYYFLLLFFRTKKTLAKLSVVFALSFFFVTTMWLNMYYFITLIISLCSLALYLLIARLKLVFVELKKNYAYLFLFLFFSFLMLLPWLFAMYDVVKFDEAPQFRGWGGAIEYSADLFGFLIPSVYNYYYTPLSEWIGNNIAFAYGIFENFTYPGIIIIATFACFFLYIKKIPHKIILAVRPYLVTSMVFFVLTLGPFLHVLGKWGFTVEEGIRIVVPLPFLLLHYVPFLGNIRAPGRLNVGFIFFAYIVTAYILSYFLRNKSAKFKYIFFAVIALIIVIDHRYIDTIEPGKNIYPYRIYKTISLDKQDVSVLDIPFAVRDGFTSFGDADGFMTLAVGQTHHNKHSLGGYFGRVSSFKARYYQDNAFLGFLGRIIDPNIATNGRIDQSDLVNWLEPNKELSRDVINFLDIKYIVTDDKRAYTATLSAFFKELGYHYKKNDDGFSLWQREIEKKDFLNVDIGTPGDSMHLGIGWNEPEKATRWVYGKGSVMFKVLVPRNFNLHFTAESFHKSQKVTVYVNKKEIARVYVGTRMKQYSVPVFASNLNTGINTVFFIFEKMYRPFDVAPGSGDLRYLSARFKNIRLSEIKK